MKRFLIFTVTAGNGHNSAANAVKEKLEAMGGEVKMVDLLHEYCDSKTFIWMQEVGYGIAVQYFNKIYNAFFKHWQKAKPEKSNKSPVQFGLIKMYDKVLQLIYDYKPDAIFTSHFFPCVMITNLRKLYPIPAKTFSFIFDYAVCPFWEAAIGIDYLLVPNESYIPQMISKGFTKQQILPYGLTVNEKFSKVMDKSKARKQLGLKDDVFTIFVMFGGGFWSGNYKIVKNLIKNLKSHSMQIIVANGRAEKDKRKIDKLKVPSNIKLLNFGFSKDVDLYMSAADIIIGKAGGVSVTEALNKFLPIICCKKLPEQERVNVEMLVREGAAKQYKSSKEMVEIVSQFLNNPKLLLQMRENIAKVRRPDATSMLAKDMFECDATYPDSSNIDYSKINKQIKKLLKRKPKQA